MKHLKKLLAVHARAVKAASEAGIEIDPVMPGVPGLQAAIAEIRLNEQARRLADALLADATDAVASAALKQAEATS